MVLTAPTYLFLIFLFVVAFAIGSIIADKSLKKKKEGKRKEILMAPIIERILRSLNCTFKYEKNDHWHEYTFKYQSGNFVLLCQDNDNYIRIHYPHFLATSLEHLEVVRQVCNECNSHNFSHHVVYTVNGKENVVTLHITSSMTIFEENEVHTENLTQILTHFFEMAQEFYARYDKVRNAEKQMNSTDVEKDNAENQREFFLLRESEIYHQEEGEVHRITGDNPLTISVLLNRIYHWDNPELIELKLITHKISYILTEQEIAQFDISSVLIGNSMDGEINFTSRSAMLILSFSANKDVPQRIPSQMTIHLQTEGRTKDILYMSATLCAIPGKLPLDHAVPVSNERTKAISFIFAYEKDEAKGKGETARRTLSEALLKDYEDLQKMISEDEKLALKFSHPITQENILNGLKYFREKRFYEAITEFEEIYNYLTPFVPKLPKRQLNDFYDICYYLGYCYCSMGLYKEGLYYLDSIFPLNNYKYMEEYINCLVNSKDYRALSIIHSLLEKVNKQVLELGEATDSLYSFHNFLKRREAYALVDIGQIDEARAIYKEMLSYPESQDYALSELAYIQRVYGKEHEEQKGEDTASESTLS